ncbi:Acetyltransferase (GNAT) family protein [Franzmannia pantelleriensis]|uniref:Acetyltransferase (GNAT) family protein n=1 Tax=Franzmannia pantelleriensis TaxID=48727 RepID=A0A1G9ERN8_9GAMM|nr:GNAT family N-acetyltransferase [Halomonas pantelleriensis]SDK78806.1 Acetyltransferase (GNAT) family protein [Halomonas pantelleriensis]
MRDDLRELIRREGHRTGEELIQGVSMDAYLDKVLSLGEALVYLQGDRLGGALLGYCNAPDSGLAYVSLLIVAEDTRGQGIGGTLLEAFIWRSVYRGFSRVQLEVQASNHTAVSLYNKHGFFRIGENESRVLMQRNLPGRHLRS